MQEGAYSCKHNAARRGVLGRTSATMRPVVSAQQFLFRPVFKRAAD